MKALHLGLKDDEIDALFRKLDINGDGTITYEEFMRSFASVNARQIIQRMQRILYGTTNMGIETIVD